MKFIRFVFPFLYVRNWHDGSWEFSHARMMLFSGFVLLVLLGLTIVYILQSPVVYKTNL